MEAQLLQVLQDVASGIKSPIIARDELLVLFGVSNCPAEKLRWVPVLYEKYGYFSDSTISLMKESLPFILKYNNGFIELIENESEIVDSFGAIEFRSVFL